MAKLEDITKGARVAGLAANETVTVIAVQWYGTNSISVTYKTDSGTLGERMVFCTEEDSLRIEGSTAWSFDADANDVKLVQEAYRISLAHLFDPYLAVRTSAIEPLPHQISAVYQEMLPRLPLRYVLADDPGAGKTIMTGLLLKEMMARGDVKRCLIVCPGSLAVQWQDELYSKFNLRFDILTNDALESAVSGNAFTEHDLCIARIDKLARNDAVRDKLAASTWDLVVCDEAHKMSAYVSGGEVKPTKRYRVGELLGSITENLLLLTATPHNGKPEQFLLFMALIDEDRFAGANHLSPQTSAQSIDVSDVMRRLVKEELLKFDGTPLFPERRAYTVEYDLSPAEQALYEAVTEYVTEEFNRADRLENARRTSVGFALTILQRRLASSPEAIYQSLKRRRERLEERLRVEKLQGSRPDRNVDWISFDTDDFDEDDYADDELDKFEDTVADAASAAATIAELEAEIATLKTLERQANAVRMSGEDRKWDELSRLLQDNRLLFDEDGRREKLIIFTEHKDTLQYLKAKISSLLGNQDAVITIQGGMSRDDRKHAEERFKQDSSVRILIATDAAGEGINLQRAHLMINYDLPWNPNRLEQRFGRIHRIGQTEVCHLWNLVSPQTREGDVFKRLFAKLETERQALGGKVFDILGELRFNGESLSDLLKQAIRYGDDPEVKDRINRVVDNSMDTESLKKLLEEYALTTDMMDVHTVAAIREQMERAEAHKLEPHYVESFFRAAMAKLGGKMRAAELGRYTVTETPYAVRMHAGTAAGAAKVLRSYDRICFDKDLCQVPGQPLAELMCPGHPLMDGLIAVLLEQNAALLKKGAVFVDDADAGTQPRLMFCVEDAIQDGTVLPTGQKRTVQKAMRFVEMYPDGRTVSAGYAPYLDYRPPTDEENDAVEQIAEAQTWAREDAERIAMDYAIQHVVPELLGEVRTRRVTQAEKAEHAVRARMNDEINYWDAKAWELRDAEAAGKRNAKLNSQNAERRAEELSQRLAVRLAQLAAEKQISALPPRIVSASLVIPAGALQQAGASAVPTFIHGDTKAVELAAMRAVMETERSLGYEPEDVSLEKCGYDILSRIPEALRAPSGPILRMIEVKGRTAGADSVTVSRNEILTALNKAERNAAYILAIVEVDGNRTKTSYLTDAFRDNVSFEVNSVNYNINHLMQVGTVLLQKEDTWQ